MDDESKVHWLKNWTDKWERNIHVVTKMGEKYIQESYAVVAHVIQLVWIFFKCVTKDTGQAFKGLGKFLWENFLPRLFF